MSTLLLTFLRPGGRSAVNAFSLSRLSSSSACRVYARQSSVAVVSSMSATAYHVHHRHGSITTRLHSTTESTSDEITTIEAQITAKGNEIRTLKDDGISKADLAPHVEELLALKAKLAEHTGGGATKEDKPNKKAETTPPKTKTPPKKDESEMSINELRESRLSKAASMRESGVEPYAYVYKPNRTASQLMKEYEGKLEPGEEDECDNAEIAVAGRIMARRVFGKLAFYTLQDETGVIQLQFDKKRLGEKDADSFKVSLALR